MQWRSPITLLLAACMLPVAVVMPGTTVAATAATVPVITPTRLPYPSGGNSVIGTGNDVGNQNAQLNDSVPATVAPSWRNSPALCPQSGGASASSISVSRTLTVVVESQYQCASVSAYSLTDGKLVWRKPYHFAVEATVSAGKVYVLHDAPEISEFQIDSLSARTGGLLWKGAVVNGQGGYGLSVGAGLVANDSHVSSARTGGSLWRARWDVGDHGRSIISGGKVFYSTLYGVTATDSKGNWLWRTVYPDGLSGASPQTSSARPSVHDGLLYLPGSKTIVVDPKTGKIVRLLPSSYKSIAFDGRTGFFTTLGSNRDISTEATVPSTVRAVDLQTGVVRWTYSFPQKGWSSWNPDTAPLVSNGVVWAASTSDSNDPTTIVALDEKTGTQRSEFVAACEDGGGGGNIAIAQHRLFVSTACGVQTYVASKTPPVVPSSGGALSDPGFERGTDGWEAMGAASVTRTSAVRRSGTGALTLTAASTTAGTIGATRTIATDAQRRAWFEASCWVRPSKAGMSVAFRTREWSPTDPSTTPTTPEPIKGTGGWDVSNLAVGVWTRLDTLHSGPGTVNEAGNSMAVQITSKNAAAIGGTLMVDDCTVTGGPPS